MNHPENLKDLNEVKVTEEIKEFIMGVSSEVEDAKGERGMWEQRQDDYYRKRFSIRRKRNFPWPGYPNFVLPLIDSDIQKAKPSYVNAAYGVSPVCTFEPFGPEDIEPAKLREQLLDYRIKHKMDFFEPYVIGIDKMLQVGHTVFKVVWDFKSRAYTEFMDIAEFPEQVIETLYDPSVTDPMLKKIIQEEYSIDMDYEENLDAINKVVEEFRNGETRFEMDLLEKEQNRAALIACDPKEDLVVPSDTTNIKDARWIDYRFYLSINDIKIAIQDGKYSKFSDEDIASWAGKGAKDQDNSSSKNYREGITSDTVSDDVVLLHELCVMYDINGDGILEKCIATYPDSDPTAILRFIELPYDHGQWPYTQIEREFIDSGYLSSRGIPALDDDFQTGISSSFNNDLANQLIVNTPYVKYVKGAVTNVRNRRYIPGEAVELRDMNGYSVEQSVNASQGTFMVTQQQLKTWAQERVGNQSFNLTGVNNSPGAGQQGKKTAREIEEVSFITSQSQGLDIIVFQMQMARVYHQIDALYQQFGQEEEFIMTGEQPIKVSRSEIQGKFNISPTGKYENTNPTIRAQKALLTLNLFRQDPDVRQDELKKWVLAEVSDPKVAKRLLVTPEEKQIAQQQAAIIGEQQKQKSAAETVDFKRVGTALELEKEFGIRQIHGRRYARDKAEEPKGNSNGKKA
jgi:hypothetical protein